MASIETYEGCFVCRSRKIRCDRAPLACLNCKKLGVQCPGYGGMPGGVTSRKGLERSVAGLFEASGLTKRRVGSCEECRRCKAKCSKTYPACSRCMRKQTACAYASTARLSPVSRLQPAIPAQMGFRFQTFDSSPLSLNSATSPTRDGMNASTTTAPDADDATTVPDDSISWMIHEDLPTDKNTVKLLLDNYFDRIHHIWCLGFLHKPSFMQSFDQGRLFQDYGQPLVHIVCALGLRAYYFDNISRFTNTIECVPGRAWVEKSRTSALNDIVQPTSLTLQTLLLNCAYAIRSDEQAATFILIANCYRVVRLLRLDSPRRYTSTAIADKTTSFVQLESELRLVWSCYILDSLIGSGIDSNLHWRDSMPDVPIPSPDASFICQTPSLSSTFVRLDPASNLPQELRSDIKANLIPLMRLRTEVLRLIRSPSLPVDVWQPGSPFLDLLTQLETWQRALPVELLPTSLNLYAHKELHTLGALSGLHFIYHSIATDLTRISLPGFDFPLAAAFRAAPAVFRRQCQQRCRFHADEVAGLVRLGFQMGGPPHAFYDDMHCAVATFESTKVQIVHTAVTLDGARLREAAVDNIRNNLHLLASPVISGNGQNPFLHALFPLLRRFSFHEITTELSHLDTDAQTEEAEVTGPADAEYLGKMSNFRLATSQVHNTKAPPVLHGNELGGQNVQDSALAPVGPPAVVGVYDGLAATANVMDQGGNNVFDTLGDPGFLSLITDEMMAEHVRLAEEMSSYITWDMGDF